VRGQGTRDNIYMVDDIPVTELGHLKATVLSMTLMADGSAFLLRG
jgi:hypothetical protein